MKEKEKNAKDDGFVEEVTLGEIHPLQLSSGGTLSPFKIAYKSWGKLNSDKSNARLFIAVYIKDTRLIDNIKL